MSIIQTILNTREIAIDQIKQNTVMRTALMFPITQALMPENIQLEVTTKCNLRCVTCLRAREPIQDMSFPLIKSVVTDLDAKTWRPRKFVLHGLGEPLLYPHLFEALELIKRGGHSIEFNSNFTAISKKDMIRLIKYRQDILNVSFDAASKENFERIRVGASYDTVLRNVKTFRDLQHTYGVTKPRVRLYTTITEDNFSEIPQIIKLADELKVDTVMFNRQLVPGKHHSETSFKVLTAWTSVPDSKVTILMKAIPTQFPTHCSALTGCFITVRGQVLPCPCLIELVPRPRFSQYVFGDVNEAPLSSIWFSKRYQRFRGQLAFGNHPAICEQCTCARQK